MASSVVTKLWVTVRDNAGRVAKTAIQIALANWDPTGALPAAWKVIIQNLIGTTSAIVKVSTAQTDPVPHSATPAPRCNREDKATLDLPDVNGITHTFRIATPSTALSAVLGSDKIDLTNTQVLAYVTAMATYGKTSDGVAFAGTITGGRYIRHKREKKGGF